MRTNIFYLLLLLSLANTIYCQNRSLYVNNFNNILSSEHLQAELFEFCKQHEINTLILYDLNKINKEYPLKDYKKSTILANFIKRAKTEEGIKKISASGESGNFFLEAIHPYNMSRKNDLEKFDIYNLEFEYWNVKLTSDQTYYCETYLKEGKLPCNRKFAFGYFLHSLEIMKYLTQESTKEIEVEAYVGNFNSDEVKELSNHADRILIHDYVYSSDRLFPYIEERLKLLNSINSKIKISILYSVEMNFLGKWLSKHDFHEAEKLLFQELEVKNINLEKSLNFDGFTYYNYDYFKYADR